MMQHNVYLLWLETDGQSDHAKLLGIYSTEERAAERISRCRRRPGFSDHVANFVITESEVDHNEWQSSLVRA